MGVCQCRHALVLHGKLRQICQNIDQLPANDFQSVPHDNNVCIIANIAGSCSQVNDALCVRTNLSICINVGHDIVTNDPFPCFCNIIINVINIVFQFLYLRRCDRQTEFHFCPSQSDPELSPSRKFLVSRKNVLHFFAGIPCTKRTFITGCIPHDF